MMPEQCLQKCVRCKPAGVLSGSVDPFQALSGTKSSFSHRLYLPVLPPDEVVVYWLRLGMRVLACAIDNDPGSVKATVAYLTTDLDPLFMGRLFMPASTAARLSELLDHGDFVNPRIIFCRFSSLRSDAMPPHVYDTEASSSTCIILR